MYQQKTYHISVNYILCFKLENSKFQTIINDYSITLRKKIINDTFFVEFYFCFKMYKKLHKTH